MEKSFVGDPIHWPGLIYAPLNNAGLVFALGAVAKSLGLLFEEFASDFSYAICRRKTDQGWERVKIAFAVKSSVHQELADGSDLLVCWIDDASDDAGLPRMELSKVFEIAASGDKKEPSIPRGLESILPESAVDDLLERGRSRESYEDTVRLLDEQIKKLQNG